MICHMKVTALTVTAIPNHLSEDNGVLLLSEINSSEFSEGDNVSPEDDVKITLDICSYVATMHQCKLLELII